MHIWTNSVSQIDSVCSKSQNIHVTFPLFKLSHLLDYISATRLFTFISRLNTFNILMLEWFNTRCILYEHVQFFSHNLHLWSGNVYTVPYNLHFRRSLSSWNLAALASRASHCHRSWFSLSGRTARKDFNWCRIIAWNSPRIRPVVSGFLFSRNSLKHLHLYARHSWKFSARFPKVEESRDCCLIRMRV